MNESDSLLINSRLIGIALLCTIKGQLSYSYSRSSSNSSEGLAEKSNENSFSFSPVIDCRPYTKMVASQFVLFSFEDSRTKNTNLKLLKDIIIQLFVVE